jgi:hypothetical protein
MRAYKDTYYRDRNAATRYSAQTILSLVLELFPAIHSVADFGCGVGAWLAVIEEKGIKEIQGVDGKWVNQDLLVIPRGCFMAADLNAPISLPKRFDLAISLEVAEHLPPQYAKGFVDSLVNASDLVLFSAAIPQQGGRNHYNEQWPDYWAAFFRDKGYGVLDVIRQRIWNDERIPYWYRQNILLYVKKGVLTSQQQERLGLADSLGGVPLPLVHPDLYLSKNAETIKAGWKHFRRPIRSSIRRIF